MQFDASARQVRGPRSALAGHERRLPSSLQRLLLLLIVILAFASIASAEDAPADSMASATDSVEKASAQLPQTDPYKGPSAQSSSDQGQSDQPLADTAPPNPDQVAAQTAAQKTTPVQVDSNPQDGQVYKVPDGVDDKTPNLTASTLPNSEPFVVSTGGKYTPPTEAENRAAQEAANAQYQDYIAAQNAGADHQFLKVSKSSITIDSIAPSSGPTTGDTRVTVRGGPFAPYQSDYPEPKCRFGEFTVGAAYVACPKRQPKAYEKEGHKAQRTSTCIQCENSPAVPTGESKTVPFAVSLSGDFTDVASSAQFLYYRPTTIKAIKPTHGPKDGGTTVQVWGLNFVEYGEDTSCSFGTRAVPAKIHDQGYLTCVAPPSDVVQRGMPFSVSLNGQQQSKDPIEYWYYNDPQVTVVDPDTGPERGGNEIKVRGENFKPFRVESGDIDISNSTFCYFVAMGAYRKAIITNSTRAVCKAPESYYFRETAVELTLNAADRTDDGTMYHYYKPPFLFDAQPGQGPVAGGTKVKVVGSNFSNSGTITCRFGENTVPAKRLSSSEVECSSPPAAQPGEVELTVQVYTGLDSAAVPFLYYEGPEVSKVDPPCGPVYGFTQLAVTGKNFVDLGRDEALCAFRNGKDSKALSSTGHSLIMTNATIINQTLIICDTPSLLNKQGYAVDADNAWVDVTVSLDGGNQMSNSSARFDYYVDPVIKSVDPPLGPTIGDTLVTLNGTGFDSKAACKTVVRLGVLEVHPVAITNQTLQFRSPKSPIPGTTTVAVSHNSQQFTKQPAVSDPSKERTFDYYMPPYTSLYYPDSGPANGGTPQRHQGYGFKLERPHLTDRFWARIVEPGSKNILAPAQEIPQDKLNIDTWSWTMPPVPVTTDTDAIMQISMNGQDWHDVMNPETGKSYHYYPTPHITSITPAFGHVKAIKDQTIDVAGNGFRCSDTDCSGLLCRFGNTPETYVYVKATYVDSTMVRCKVPQYTKPDVLFVEVTVNGESYTNDNKTFGYFDPFVLDADPKLLATDGTTNVQVKGLGFVNSGETRVSYGNRTTPLTCNGACAKPALFVDKHTLNTTSFRQDEVRYTNRKKEFQNVGFDPIYIDATVIGDEFTQNQVEVFYYEDPVLTNANIAESPANLQSQLLLSVDFKNNDLGRLFRLATPRCRWTAGSKVQTTEGQLVVYPFSNNRDPNRINSIHCKTPKWKLDSDAAEQATLDVSLNGQNYVGGAPFTFTRELKLHRDVPMSGPNGDPSPVHLIGQGYRLKARVPSIKWGLQTTEAINASAVKDYTYNRESYLDTFPGNQALRAYETEAANWPRVDSVMTEGGSYDEIILKSQFPDVQEGVAYLETGLDETLERDDGQPPWTLYTYEPSSVEFYSYKTPQVLKMHPTAGLNKGGTFVEVLGTWFHYAPEYGIVPHCRFGDQVVRAHFDSTVRLVCQSPPAIGANARLPFEISLNGVDWSHTGFTFAYYEEPIMTDIYPDMGAVGGGEEVFIRGSKFSNHTDPTEFMCRFTPTTLQVPAKTTAARYVNSTVIACPAPGGWPQGDHMILQVTWNGVDYDQNNFQYSYYSVHRAFPRSGPSDGKGGDIIVSGQGFRPEANPKCRLNNTEHTPLSVSATEIRCPMPPAEPGPTFFGNVDFAVTPNGHAWYPFDGGFQYYQQPVVEDIDPKTGPSTGVGIINFYGQDFRADYPLAELGCKVGGATGKAFYVSARQVKCVVEDMPLPAENEDPLPAVVSLNSYSYTESTPKTSFRPYGVRHLQPNSGPVGGITTVVVQGQGFVAEEGVTPRCRFGTPANYAIVEAEILSYTRLACRTPDFLPLTPTAALPRDVPFSIALSADEFNPWTRTPHRFRFYEQPTLAKIDPDELEVGRIAEVYITTAEGSEFFEPMPLSPASENGTTTTTSAPSSSLAAMKCKFGRFGEASAIFINSSCIKCTTPPYDESPDTIYRESVPVSVALNGQDFAEDTSTIEFTFLGTAPYVSFAAILLTLAAIAFLGYAVALLIEACYPAPASDPPPQRRPHNVDQFRGEVQR